MKKIILALAMIFLILVAVDINNGFVNPLFKEDNQASPGGLLQVNQLEQIIADQELTILSLQEQINVLEALLDAMENYIQVPRCPQIESSADRDENDPRRSMD